MLLITPITLTVGPHICRVHRPTGCCDWVFIYVNLFRLLSKTGAEQIF